MTKQEIIKKIRDTQKSPIVSRLEIWKEGQSWKADIVYNFDNNEEPTDGSIYIESGCDFFATLDSAEQALIEILDYAKI
jgi:hypothetical protein